jgi:hypothetical protein
MSDSNRYPGERLERLFVNDEPPTTDGDVILPGEAYRDMLATLRWVRETAAYATPETALNVTQRIAQRLALTPRLDPATCRAQGHGRVACQDCGAELVDVASVREREAYRPIGDVTVGGEIATPSVTVVPGFFQYNVKGA